MERDTLSEDLTVVGLVLIILVMCSVLFTKIHKIEKELIQAKELVVELDVNLNEEDYHIITFSNLSMCRMYQEVILSGKYDDTVIKYINN